MRMKDKTERKSMRETEKGRKGVRERERERWRQKYTVFLQQLPCNWQAVFVTEEVILKSKEQIDENILYTPI